MPKLVKFVLIIILNIVFISNYTLSTWAETELNYKNFFKEQTLSTEYHDSKISLEDGNFNTFKIPLEIFVGYLFSIACFAGFYLLGTFLGGIIEPKPKDDPDLITIKGATTGYVLSMASIPLGSSLGVYLIGNIGNETGSFLFTLLGSIIGVITWLLSAFLIYNINNTGTQPFVIIGLIFVPIGATIGFNLSKQKKEQMEEIQKKVRVSHQGIVYNVFSF